MNLLENVQRGASRIYFGVSPHVLKFLLSLKTRIVEVVHPPDVDRRGLLRFGQNPII